MPATDPHPSGDPAARPAAHPASGPATLPTAPAADPALPPSAEPSTAEPSTADPSAAPAADSATLGPRAILLTGPLGSGKTTVAIAIGAELDRAGVRNAVIDLDWLCWVGPDITGEDLDMVLAESLAAVVRVHRRRGIDRFVLARTVTTQHQLETLRTALGPGASVALIALAVPPMLLAARLRERGTGGDADEQADLAASTTVIPDAEVPNAGRTPRETARDVLDAAG